MITPTVFILNNSSQFINEIKSRLHPFGISVMGKYEFSNFDFVVDHEALAKCLLINVDAENFHSLQINGIFTDKNRFKDIPIILLIQDEKLYHLIEKKAYNTPLKVFHSNILLEHLEYEILASLPYLGHKDTQYGHIASVFGRSPKITLSWLLQFLNQHFFTGIVTIENQRRTGTIRIDKGQIRGIEYNKLPPGQALRTLLQLNDATFRVEQRIYNHSDVLQYMEEGEKQTALSENDLLVDLFYFMHNHLERSAPESTLKKIIEETFQASTELFANGVYLMYDENIQERLCIVGKVGAQQVPLIWQVFEKIYNQLIPSTEQKSFPEFVDSLHELRPYLKQIMKINIVLSDKETEMLPQ